MSEGVIIDLIDFLSQIEQDSSVPRNVRGRIKAAMEALQEEGKEVRMKANKALQQLDEVSDDPNIPPYVRPQIWNVVSLLEGI